MVDEETDIAVIGAGPAGLITARDAARRGVNIAVLEEHEEIGVPCHCAGLLSLKGLREIQVPPDESFIQNRVNGAHFFSPSGLSFTIERDEHVALVVNRALLDRFLAKQAAQAGAHLMLNSKVESIERVGGGILLSGNFGTIKADVAVDAEAVASHFTREMGLQPLMMEDLLPALQYDLKGVDIDPRYVEVHVGRSIAPSFFAWVIPLNESSVRIGLACKGDNPREKLEQFMKKRFNDRVNLTRVHVRSGLIVTSGPISRTFCDNFLAVGDVAGQVKPTTGGGVIWGGICAMIAGTVAAEAVETGNYTQGFLRRYEISWRKKLEKDMMVALVARRIANRLSDETIEKIFKIIIESNLQKELSLEGNMDFQARTILQIARRRDILKILFSSASDLIGNLRE